MLGCSRKRPDPRWARLCPRWRAVRQPSEERHGSGVSPARSSPRSPAPQASAARARLVGVAGRAWSTGTDCRRCGDAPALPGHRRLPASALPGATGCRHGVGDAVGSFRARRAAAGPQPAQLRSSLAARAGLASFGPARARDESGRACAAFRQEPELGVSAPGAGV